MINSGKIKGAFKWQLLNMSVQAIFQFAFIMLSARILPKEVHGSFAILYALVFVLTISSEGGVSSAIIQRKEVNKKHISIAFYVTVVLSLILFFLLVSFSNVIVEFYEGKITRNNIVSASLIFIIMAVGKVSEAFLVKNFQFKQIFIAKNTGFFLGNILAMYIIAKTTGGIYALIWGYVITQFFTSLIYFFYSRHPLAFHFGKKEFNELFYFGSSFTILRIVNYLSSQIDKLLLGKYFTVTSLSIYEKGQFVSKIPPKYIGNSIDSIMFSAFAKIDNQILKANYLKKIISIVLILSAYFSVIFYFNADLIIELILGQNWYEVGPFLKILVLTMPALLLARLGDVIVRAENLMFKSIPIKILFLVSLAVVIYFLKDINLIELTKYIVVCYWFHGISMLVLSCNMLKINFLDITKLILVALLIVGIVYLKYYFIESIFESGDLSKLIIQVVSDFIFVVILLGIFKNHPIVQNIRSTIFSLINAKK